MAIGAGYPFLYMYTEVVFRGLLLVASVAGNLLDLDLLPHVLGKVNDIHVATGTGVLAMHRGGKGRHRDLVTVTAETGGRVDGHPLLGGGGKGDKDEE
jgi:hypothetical protein